MKRFFFHSVQGKIISILLLFMTVSLLAMLFVVQYMSQRIISSEKANKLLMAAAFLDFELGERDYESILIENNAQDAAREDKIAVLNRVLSPLGDSVTKLYPDIGIGYYSLALDAILTYAPSSLYGDTVGRSIAADHPGRIVMQNNESLVRTGSMVRGNIMNAMHPLARNGIVIGYAWANELSSSIETEYRQNASNILLLMVAVYVVSVIMAVALARRSMRDIDNIVKGVRTMRSDLAYLIPTPKNGGDLGEVVENINLMAQDILKAEEDHKALLLSEAANLAQRDFLSRMSHEIRTPMNGVLGMTKLAQEANSEAQRMEYLSKIHTSVSLLLGIINDILDISRIEANKMKIEANPFKMAEIIDSIRDLMLPRVSEKHLALKIEVADSVPEIAVGDSLRISQALFNIVGNAVKFTLKGSVMLCVSANELPNNHLRLNFTVRDTGIGMSDELQRNIFKPFTQADSSTARKFGGSGLGLSITKALVELMGGKITVTSAPDEGSEFAFYVIAKCFKAANQPQTEDDLAAIMSQSYDNYKLLLVEDNEINQEIGKAVLEAMGFSIDVANNGQEGVEAYKARPYNLIFMDIRMPVMDGLEATREIRKLEKDGAHTPIIAMTANAMQADKEATAAAGMDNHVSKPLDIEEIRRALYKALIAN